VEPSGEARMSRYIRRHTLRIAEEAAEWLDALEAGETSVKEAFVEWLQASPQHLEEFLLLTASERAYAQIRPTRPIEVGELLTSRVASLVPLEDDPTLSEDSIAHDRKRRLISPWKWVAAAALIIIATATTLLRYAEQRSWKTYATDIGEQRSIELDDHSLIHLNARSQVAVRFSDHERAVRLLAGEALFKVTPDAVRAFKVDAGDAIIRVIGTQFDVDRRVGDTRVAVIEGRVEIAPHEAHLPQLAELTAGNGAHVKPDGKILRTPVDTADVTAWRQRRLVFRGNTLADIVTEFNRYNKTPQLVIEDESVGRLRYGGTFDADAPQALMDFLAQERSLRLQRRGDVVRIWLRSP